MLKESAFTHVVTLLLVAVSAVSLRNPSAGQAAPDPRVQIPSPTRMWQALPSEVGRVLVGPDDRPWFVLRDRPRMDLAAFKQRVEREFARPDPQLVNGQPALFEPGGRVWFTFNGQTRDDFRDVVLGYDGKQWVERVAPGNARFFGNCPNHGGDEGARGGNNLFAAGHAFLVAGTTIHAFDGREWSTFEFAAEADDVRFNEYPARLQVDADGRGVLAIVQLGEHKLYRWRDGKWKPLGVPPEATGYIAAAAPTDKGVWLLVGAGELVFTPYDAPVRTVADYVRLLADDRPDVRAAVRRGLDAAGRPILAKLEAVAARGVAAPLAQPLNELIAKIRARPGNAPWLEPAPAKFGPYAIRSARFLFPDGFGRVFVGGVDVSRPGFVSGNGIVMRDRDGEFLSLGGEETLNRWRNPHLTYGVEGHPLVLGGPDAVRVWVPGNGADVPAALFDVKHGRFTAEVPDPRYRLLQAARTDGTVYAAIPLERTAAVMVLSPGKPDNRLVLREQLPPRAIEWALCIASDGSVWASPSGAPGLTRFTDGAWRDVPAAADAGRVTSLFPGRDGALLVRFVKRWGMLTPAEFHVADSLETLIERHTTAFVKAFSGVLPPHHNDGPAIFAVTADPRGNQPHVWLAQRPTLQPRVFAGGKWIDASGALRAAGMRDGKILFATAVGDGSRVYLGDFALRHDGGASFLAHVAADGKVVVDPAPHCINHEHMRWPVREPGGALWVPATFGRADGPSDLITGQAACRVTEKGQTHRVDGFRPLFADTAGNVFLVPFEPDSGGRLRVWRDGEVTCDVDVSGIDDSVRLFNDSPGSVLVWTKNGVQRLTEEPGKPGAFTAGPVMTPRFTATGPVGVGHPHQVEWSPQGFLVVLTKQGYPTETSHVHLLSVPK